MTARRPLTHAARVSDDVRRLITLAQTFADPALRAAAVEHYADHLGYAPMPPFGAVDADTLHHAADAIHELAAAWSNRDVSNLSPAPAKPQYTTPPADL